MAAPTVVRHAAAWSSRRELRHMGLKLGQSHRGWDLSALGPFTSDRVHYELALQKLEEEMRALPAG